MTLVGVRGFDSCAGLGAVVGPTGERVFPTSLPALSALRWSATRVPRRWGRETRRIQAYGRPFADVPHDGARHTALRRRVGNGRVLPGSTPGAGMGGVLPP